MGKNWKTKYASSIDLHSFFATLKIAFLSLSYKSKCDQLLHRQMAIMDSRSNATACSLSVRDLHIEEQCDKRTMLILLQFTLSLTC